MSSINKTIETYKNCQVKSQVLKDIGINYCRYFNQL